MDLGLESKACIVTGGSRGIGLEVSRALVAEGARVAIVARDRTRVEAAARELDPSGQKVYGVSADLSSEAGVQNGFALALERLGRIDVLVNNAGAPAIGHFDAVNDSDWFEVINLKLIGYARAIRAVLPVMRKQGRGRIVNVVGAAGRFATPDYVLGCVNAACLHLTKSLAEHVGAEGISVIAVNPGITGPSPRLDGAIQRWAELAGVDKETIRSQIDAGLALRRIATTDEVARFVVLACSDVFEYATGSAVQADGGYARGAF